MNRIIVVMWLFLASACGQTQSLPEEKNSNLYSLPSHTVRLIPSDIEATSQCPALELLTPDKTKKLDKLELCTIAVSGYREFDARRDFAYIDFMDFSVKNGSIQYSVDIELLRGSAFIAKCMVSVKDNKLMQEGCSKQ